MENLISNNFYNGEVIVSYDSNKTWEEKVDDNIIVYKKTEVNEFKNILKMKKLLQNKSINIKGRKYKLKVPSVYDWDDNKGILAMEFCKGKNLEFYLRNENTYNKGQFILNKILNFLIQNQIYWLDFAARNIIVGKNEIYFVDYEKGFGRKNIKIKEFFRNHVYEEYCVFLFLKDRKYSIDEILSSKREKNNTFNLSQIKCKRCYTIAKLLGYNQTITKRQYLDILKMLITVQEPKVVDDKFYFPCVELDKIFVNDNKEIALEKYCKKVINLYINIKNS